MARKCPPGVLCVETGTIVTAVVVLAIALAAIHARSPAGPEFIRIDAPQFTIENEDEVVNKVKVKRPVVQIDPKYAISDGTSVLMNPYMPPVSMETRGLRPVGHPPNRRRLQAGGDPCRRSWTNTTTDGPRNSTPGDQSGTTTR